MRYNKYTKFWIFTDFQDKRMKKKFIIIAAALLFLVPLSVLFQFMWNMSLSSKAKTAQGNTVSLDKSIAEILAQTDREMSKQGYIINPKRIDSYNSDGTTELLPVGGMDMRSIKVISTYTLPREIMSHEKSAYGSFLEKCQGLFGRLPEIFYSLDLTKYEGSTEYRQVETTIEYIFILIKDDGDSGKYKAYSSACKRTDSVSSIKSIVTEDGETVEDISTEVTTEESPHYGGDLSWLKEMAYNNYFSKYSLSEAFECTADTE